MKRAEMGLPPKEEEQDDDDENEGSGEQIGVELGEAAEESDGGMFEKE